MPQPIRDVRPTFDGNGRCRACNEFFGMHDLGDMEACTNNWERIEKRAIAAEQAYADLRKAQDSMSTLFVTIKQTDYTENEIVRSLAWCLDSLGSMVGIASFNPKSAKFTNANDLGNFTMQAVRHLNDIRQRAGLTEL